MEHLSQAMPHSIRLVIFPRQGSEFLAWQYSELTYAMGYPAITGAESGAMFAAPDWSDRMDRLDTMLACAKALRSQR